MNMLFFYVDYVSYLFVFQMLYKSAETSHFFTPTAIAYVMMSSAVALFSDLLVVYHLIGTALFIVLDRL